jgi:hypothetical protein
MNHIEYLSLTCFRVEKERKCFNFWGSENEVAPTNIALDMSSMCHHLPFYETHLLKHFPSQKFTPNQPTNIYIAKRFITQHET